MLPGCYFLHEAGVSLVSPPASIMSLCTVRASTCPSCSDVIQFPPRKHMVALYDKSQHHQVVGKWHIWLGHANCILTWVCFLLFLITQKDSFIGLVSGCGFLFYAKQKNTIYFLTVCIRLKCLIIVKLIKERLQLFIVSFKNWCLYNFSIFLVCYK